MVLGDFPQLRGIGAPGFLLLHPHAKARRGSGFKAFGLRA